MWQRRRGDRGRITAGADLMSTARHQTLGLWLLVSFLQSVTGLERGGEGGRPTFLRA